MRQQCKQLKEDYVELERECERLKSYGATLLADKNAMEIGRDDYLQRCKQLEQECEELKKENQELEHERLCARNDYLCKRQVTNHYRKALEEIELTIKNLEKDDILTFPDFTLQENATIIMNQCNQGYRDIFDIINKVKGEGK